MPSGLGPFPAILEYLPYRKRDGTAPRDETTHPVFADAGYVCVRIDIAGSGDSDGHLKDEYCEQELDDGEAVLEWIAAQSWCSGNVGIIGISWGGFNGLQLAYRQPEALKAVVSVASTSDRFIDDCRYMDGCLLTDNFNWSAQLSTYQARPPDPEIREDWREEWVSRMQGLPFFGAKWLCHQTRDEYWEHGSVCEDFSRVTVPVLAVTGWADAYVNTPLILLENLNGPTKALIGAWEHRYAHLSRVNPSDFHSEVIGWFDRWLKYEQNGAEDLPSYRAFMQEHFNPQPVSTPRRGRWVAETSWPSPNIRHMNWYLGKSALTKSVQNGTVTVATPAHVGNAGGNYYAGMLAENELPGDQRPDDALSVCFDTPALDDPLELMGRACLTINFLVNRPVAQIVVRLCDVSPDGVSQRISFRAVNLTYHGNNETPETLSPGKLYSATIKLNECAHRLRKGHKLRLALSNSYWPMVWPAPEPVILELDLAGCKLDLPIRSVGVETEAAAPDFPQDHPILMSQILRHPDSTVRFETLPDGTFVRENEDDLGETRNPDHGLVSGYRISTRYSIHPDNPTSAKIESRWQFSCGRGKWQTEIEIEGTMTCDRDNFYLTRKLRSTESVHKSEVVTKEWSESIPRGLL